MNISDELRNYFVFPSGGFATIPETNGYVTYKAAPRTATRADTESSSDATTWTIEGASFGVEWWAIPEWSKPCRPKMIDVKVPDQTEWPPELWDLWDVRDTVHRSGKRAVSSGFARHLQTALNNWSQRSQNIEDRYESLPFRSTMKVSTVTVDPSLMDFELSLNDVLDKHMLTYDALKTLWGIELPSTVEVTDLIYDRRVESTVALVTIEDGKSSPDRQQRRRWAFKFGNGSCLNLIYHEIKALLTLSPNPSVEEKPSFLVTTKSPTTGEQLVCGFLQKFYEGGSLDVALPTRLNDNSLSLQLQLSWSKSITSALISIVRESGLFYPDLKTDNVILDIRNGIEVPVLVDFEMDRNLYNWAPPEIYYLEWLAELSYHDVGRVKNKHVNPDARERAHDIFLAYLHHKGDPPLPLKADRYSNPPLGYYWPWLLCSPQERESAEVYMLGRLLWCIFEGVADGNNVLGRSFEHQTDQLFPEFRRSPQPIRQLIRSCTAGAREWSDGQMSIVRIEGQLFPRGMTGENGEPLGTLEDTQAAIHTFWRSEIDKAEAFVNARIRCESGTGSAEDKALLDYLRRPALTDVLRALEHFEQEHHE